MNTVIAVDLIKGRPGPWPRIESETHIVSTGSVGPLEDSVRTAQSDLVHWLTEDFGLELMDAYQLVTPAVLGPLAHVCDTNYTSVANFLKRCPPGAGRGRPWEAPRPTGAVWRRSTGGRIPKARARPSRDPACGAALAPRCHSGVRVRSPDGVILAEGTRKFDSAPLRR
jgi:hypothetical protein